MTTRIEKNDKTLWMKPDGKDHWGNVFQVKWIKIHDLPFRSLTHLRNAYNDNLPIKRSRDGQELPPHIGKDMVVMMDTEVKAPSAVDARTGSSRHRGGRARRRDRGASTRSPWAGMRDVRDPRGSMDVRSFRPRGGIPHAMTGLTGYPPLLYTQPSGFRGRGYDLPRGYRDRDGRAFYGGMVMAPEYYAHGADRRWYGMTSPGRTGRADSAYSRGGRRSHRGGSRSPSPEPRASRGGRSRSPRRTSGRSGGRDTSARAESPESSAKSRSHRKDNSRRPTTSAAGRSKIMIRVKSRKGRR